MGPGSTASPSVAFGGAFDPNAFHHLRYDVDTFTGAISNIRFGASTADYSGLTSTLFTDAATMFAGMYTSSAVASGLGAVDNFLVTVVPEPSTVGLLCGLAPLFVSRRSRRQGC